MPYHHSFSHHIILLTAGWNWKNVYQTDLQFTVSTYYTSHYAMIVSSSFVNHELDNVRFRFYFWETINKGEMIKDLRWHKNKSSCSLELYRRLFIAVGITLNKTEQMLLLSQYCFLTKYFLTKSIWIAFFISQVKEFGAHSLIRLQFRNTRWSCWLYLALW